MSTDGSREFAPKFLEYREDYFVQGSNCVRPTSRPVKMHAIVCVMCAFANAFVFRMAYFTYVYSKGPSMNYVRFFLHDFGTHVDPGYYYVSNYGKHISNCYCGRTCVYVPMSRKKVSRDSWTIPNAKYRPTHGRSTLHPPAIAIRSGQPRASRSQRKGEHLTPLYGNILVTTRT